MIRTIKPEFFRHEELFKLERETKLPLRLAFAGTLDRRRSRGSVPLAPTELKLDVLPYDDVDLAYVLEWLSRGKFIVHYVVDGDAYGFIPSWKKHRVINNRECRSRIPEPKLDAEVHLSLIDLAEENGFIYLALAPISKLVKVGSLPARPTRAPGSTLNRESGGAYVYRSDPWPPVARNRDPSEARQVPDPPGMVLSDP